MQGTITVEDSRTAGTVTQFFLRRLGIGGLAALASLGLADRVNATYFELDDARAPIYAKHYTAGDYIDRERYNLLDDSQYYYLDRGQYNLLGGLGYLLGHPYYPKLYERDSDQAVGFTNRVNTGWFSFWGGQIPVSEYDVSQSYFNTGDYIDRRRYYYLDKGQYLYLDREQYDLLGGLGYSFGMTYYQKRADMHATPEPSTIVFLVLGALGVLVLRNKRRTGEVT